MKYILHVNDIYDCDLLKCDTFLMRIVFQLITVYTILIKITYKNDYLFMNARSMNIKTNINMNHESY